MRGTDLITVSGASVSLLAKEPEVVSNSGDNFLKNVTCLVIVLDAPRTITELLYRCITINISLAYGPEHLFITVFPRFSAPGGLPIFEVFGGALNQARALIKTYENLDSPFPAHIRTLFIIYV